MSDEDVILPSIGDERPRSPRIDLSNPNEVKLLDEMLAERAAQRAADLKAILALPEGRRVLWSLLEMAGLYESTFSDSHARMALAAGRREFGTWLIREIEAVDITAYPQLMLDGRKDREMERLIHEARRNALGQRQN